MASFNNKEALNGLHIVLYLTVWQVSFVGA